MLESYAGEIASTVCSMIWALALIFFAKAGRSVPPRALNVLKSLIVLPLFVITCLALGIDLLPELDGWTWGVMAVSAVIGWTISDTLVFASLNRIGAGWTAVVSCAYSPLMILVTGVGFGVALTWNVAVGSVIVGAAIVIATGRVRLATVEGRTLAVGLALGVAAELGMAISVAMMKYPIMGHPAIFDVAHIFVITVWRMVIGTSALILWMALRHDRAIAFTHFRPNREWRWVVLASVIGSYVAMSLWIYGMKAITGSLTRAAILNQTTAIWLPILGVLLLNERLNARKLIAVAMAFVGATIVILGR